jgi:hypothetical protein
MGAFIPERPRSRGRIWTLVFVLNLIVPLFFGWMLTADSGRFGMAAGIGLLWYLGYRACGQNDWWGRALVRGGFLVALTQLFPLLQIWAGVVGVGIASALGPLVMADTHIGGTIHTGLGGLIATVLTGLSLMGVAAFCGAITVWLTSRRAQTSPAHGSVLYDRQLDG